MSAQAKGLSVAFSRREARVTLDVMERISAHTYDELREFYGWTKRDIDAWAEALRKIDRALTEARP